MRECVSSRQRFRSNCPVNAALHRPCSWLSPPLAFGSSLYLFSPPAAQRCSISVFVVNTARSFSLFLYPRINFCLLLMAGSRPRRDRFQLSRWPSNTPPLPFSPSLSSFVRSSLSNQWTLLSLRSLHSIRPLYRSNFSLSLLAVSAYISLVFHFAWNKSAIILIQLSTIFSPISPLYLSW